MNRWSAAALVALVLAGCQRGEGAPPEPVEGDAAAAFDACLDGRAEGALARLDGLAAERPADPDVLAARGLCHWTRWSESADPEDARRAYADLTAAIDASGDAAREGDLLSRRAFVARALDGGWVRTLEDLDRAVALAPADAGHRLDRGVVHLYAGDSSSARRDLARYLALADPADADRQAVAQALLDDLGPEPAPDSAATAAARTAADPSAGP